MVWVTYHCPYCGAVTGVERDAYLDDKCVTREPLAGWTYADTTGDVEAADGIEFVCLGGGSQDGRDAEEVSAGGSDDADQEERATSASEGGGANDPRVEKDGCGRTFYLSFLKYEDGAEVEHRTPDVDRPRFDFNT